MDTLAKKLTDYIIDKKIILPEHYEIYHYGLTCFLELLISFITCVIISMLLKMPIECLIFFAIFIPLRSFGGGLHLNTYLHCYLASCTVLTITLLLVKYITIPAVASLILCFISLILLFIIGPVDNPNRPVSSDENQLFKRRTNITLIVCGIVAGIFYGFGKYQYLFLEAIILIVLIISNAIPIFTNKEAEG